MNISSFFVLHLHEKRNEKRETRACSAGLLFARVAASSAQREQKPECDVRLGFGIGHVPAGLNLVSYTYTYYFSGAEFGVLQLQPEYQCCCL